MFKPLMRNVGDRIAKAGNKQGPPQVGEEEHLLYLALEYCIMTSRFILILTFDSYTFNADLPYTSNLGLHIEFRICTWASACG